MEHTYQKSWFIVIKDCLIAVVGIVFLFFFLRMFFSLHVSFGICGVITFIWAIFIFDSAKIKVVVLNNNLDIYTKREEYHYLVDQVDIGFKNDNNDSLTLYVTDLSGKRESFDLSLIGTRKVYDLLEDLSVIGDNMPISKLESIKKDEFEEK